MFFQTASNWNSPSTVETPDPGPVETEDEIKSSQFLKRLNEQVKQVDEIKKSLVELLSTQVAEGSQILMTPNEKERLRAILLIVEQIGKSKQKPNTAEPPSESSMPSSTHSP